MPTCHKCGYERQDQDDQFTPPGECPRCGVVYSKSWQLEMQYRAAKAANDKEEKHRGEIRSERRRPIVTFICVFLVCAGCYTAYRHYFSQPKAVSKPWTTLYSEASNFFNEGHYSEALPLAKLALSKAEQEKKPDQKKILEIMELVAETHMQLGEYKQCVDCLEMLKVGQEKTFGPDHQEVTTTMSKLSSAYRYLGNDEKANSLIHQIISINERKTASAVALAASKGAERSSYSDNTPTTAPERQGGYVNDQKTGGSDQSPIPSDCAYLEDIYIKCRAYKCNLIKYWWTLGAEQFCNNTCSQYSSSHDYSSLRDKLYGMGCYNDKNEYCRFTLRRHYELNDPFAKTEYKMKGCGDM